MTVAHDRPVLTIDPAVQGGEVCVENTRIPASQIGGMVFAGDSVNVTANDYFLSREQVLLCCWWWGNEEQYQRTKQGRAVMKRWSEWIDTAHRHFALTLHPDKLDDPPCWETA